MQAQLLAGLLATTLIAAPLRFAHAAPSVEDLYSRGQEKFDAGENREAADLWAQAARALDESPDTTATRQTIVALSVDAYLRAYDGDQDRSHLDQAKALLDDYETSLAPSSGKLSADLEGMKDKVESQLAELDKPDESEPEPEPEPEPAEPEPEPKGKKPGMPFIIGGAVLLGVGAAGIGLLVAGMVGGASAEQDFYATEPGSGRTDSYNKGQVMNGLAITGAVVAPLMIGAGIGLLIVGIKRNKAAGKHALIVLPSAGPEQVGVQLSARF